MDNYGYDYSYDFPSGPPQDFYGDISYDVDPSGPSYTDYLLDENYGNEGGNYLQPGSTQPGAPGTGGSPINQESGPDFGKILQQIRGFLPPGLGGSGGAGGAGGGGLSDLIRYLMFAGIAGGTVADKRRETGGGGTEGWSGPRKYNPRVERGRYGPIRRYASGGPVRMEDGSFVINKRAVDGAGGPQGIQKLIPSARMIHGPGHGTSDDVPAVIVSDRGVTPAALSNGEAYVPKRTVQNMGGAQQLYALMNALQKRG